MRPRIGIGRFPPRRPTRIVSAFVVFYGLVRSAFGSMRQLTAGVTNSATEKWTSSMEDERFNMSLRKFLKKVGVTSQHEIERVVREQRLEGKGILKVKMVLTAEGTDLKHEVEDQIDLG